MPTFRKAIAIGPRFGRGCPRLVSDGVKDAKHISLAIDESTDNTYISQLCVFVRYFDGKDFREELPALISRESLATGDHLKKSTWLSQMVLLP